MSTPKVIQILKAHNALEKFIRNAKYDPINPIHHEEYFSGFFSWADSPEGWDFWYGIDTELCNEALGAFKFHIHDLQKYHRIKGLKKCKYTH